jgi:hypothetical protein
VFARITAKGVPTASTQMLAILSSLALATLTFLLIEKPIRLSRYHKTKAAIFCFLMLAVAFLGFNTYTRDGLAFRLS